METPGQENETTKSDPTKSLVILDLDGTITKSDTLIPFLVGCLMRHPRFRMRMLLLPLDIILFALGRLDTTEFKARLLTAFVSGLSVDALESWARHFALRVAESGCRGEMLSLIERARESGDRLILLSASPDIYVGFIAESLGINETISTRVEVRAGRYTGKLVGRNCKGREKLRRLKNYLGSDRYEGFAVAIGNEESDRWILEWADEGLLLRGSRLVKIGATI